MLFRSPTSEGTLLIPNPLATGPAVSAADSSSATASSSNLATSNSNTTNGDRATLFTSHPAASYPAHTLPAFFGTTLNVARRGNLVFRNGAYGIPKASVGDDRGRKGKEKLVEERETNEPEHNLSVGIGEDAVSRCLCAGQRYGS